MRLDVGIAIAIFFLAVAGVLTARQQTDSRVVGEAGQSAFVFASQLQQKAMPGVAASTPMNVEAVAHPIKALQLAQADDLTAVIATRRDEIYSDPEAPVGGNPKGDVTIVEFFDYNCPYCRKVASVLDELMQTDANIRIVYKEFPILGPNSTFAARAALATRNQGKYLEFHKAVMLGRRVADKVTVMEFARMAGLDIDRLKADMENPAVDAILRRNLSLAEALQISGTPAFIIADDLYAGAAELEDFRRVIAEVRESADPAQ